MLGPIRFVFVVIWFAIGLGIVGTLKDCTAIMGKKAAEAHKHGGISYVWWNHQLVDRGDTRKSVREIERKK